MKVPGNLRYIDPAIKMVSTVISKVLSPAETGKFVTDTARDVAVISGGIQKAADEVFEALQTKKLSLKNFKQCELHPKVADEKAIDWIFLVDTLNFSFWSGPSKSTEAAEDNPKWEVGFKGKVYTGYFASCAAINRAIEEGIDITNPKVFGSLSLEEIQRIFRSETKTPIPLLEDRQRNLKEVASVLLSKYDGSFANCVKESKQNAEALLKLIVEDFPCFRDEATYEHIEQLTVSFYKRAQILIADIWACFEGKGLGQFDNIGSLTMFADYRIPQVLLHFGAIRYSPDLNSHLEKDLELSNGERREVEIRAVSIHAVELIKAKVQERLISQGMNEDDINAVMIDHFLWDYRRENAVALEQFPYHKTRCIYY